MEEKNNNRIMSRKINEIVWFFCAQSTLTVISGWRSVLNSLTLLSGWGWRGVSVVAGGDNGASHPQHGRIIDVPLHHDISVDAQDGVPGGRHRAHDPLRKVPAPEHHLPRVWPSLQGWSWGKRWVLMWYNLLYRCYCFIALCTLPYCRENVTLFGGSGGGTT